MRAHRANDGARLTAAPCSTTFPPLTDVSRCARSTQLIAHDYHRFAHCSHCVCVCARPGFLARGRASLVRRLFERPPKNPHLSFGSAHAKQIHIRFGEQSPSDSRYMAPRFVAAAIPIVRCCPCPCNSPDNPIPRPPLFTPGARFHATIFIIESIRSGSTVPSSEFIAIASNVEYHSIMDILYVDRSAAAAATAAHLHTSRITHRAHYQRSFGCLYLYTKRTQHPRGTVPAFATG